MDLPSCVATSDDDVFEVLLDAVVERTHVILVPLPANLAVVAAPVVAVARGLFRLLHYLRVSLMGFRHRNRLGIGCEEKVRRGGVEGF